MIRSVIAGTLLPLLPLTPPLLAQRITSPYQFVETKQTVEVFLGHVSTGKGRLGLGPDAASIGGLRYSIRLGGPFQMEGTLGYMPTQRMVLDTAVVENGRTQLGKVDQTLLTALAGLRFDLTGARTFHHLLPYLLMGGGITMDLKGTAPLEDPLPPDVRFDFGTAVTGQLGGGIEWYVSPRFALSLDARNVLWKLKTPAPFQQGDAGLNVPSSQWTQNFQASAGLAIHF